MKNKSNIYVLKLDSSLDETLKNFRLQLSKDEEIVNTSISETKVVVVTQRKSKLLTDELKRM